MEMSYLNVIFLCLRLVTIAGDVRYTEGLVPTGTLLLHNRENPGLWSALSYKDPLSISQTSHLSSLENSTERAITNIDIDNLNRPRTSESIDLIPMKSSYLDISDPCVDNTRIFRLINGDARDCTWIRDGKEWGTCNSEEARKNCRFTCDVCNSMALAVTNSSEVNTTIDFLTYSLSNIEKLGKQDYSTSIENVGHLPIQRISYNHEENQQSNDYDITVSKNLHFLHTCHDTLDIFILESGMARNCTWIREFKTQGSCNSNIARRKCPRACDGCKRDRALSMSMYYSHYSRSPSSRRPSHPSPSIIIHSKPPEIQKAPFNPSSSIPPSKNPATQSYSLKPSFISELITVSTTFKSNLTIAGLLSPKSSREALEVATTLLGPLTKASHIGTQISINMIDSFSLSPHRRSLKESSIDVQFTSMGMMTCLPKECNSVTDVWYENSKNSLIESIDSGKFITALVNELETRDVRFANISIDRNSFQLGVLEIATMISNSPPCLSHAPSTIPSTQRKTTSYSPTRLISPADNSHNADSTKFDISWKKIVVSSVVIGAFLSGIVIIVIVRKQHSKLTWQLKDGPYPTISWPSSNHSTVDWPDDDQPPQQPTTPSMINWPKDASHHPIVDWPKDEQASFQSAVVEWPKSDEPHYPIVDWPTHQTVVVVVSNPNVASSTIPTTTWPTHEETKKEDENQQSRIPPIRMNEPLPNQGSLLIYDGFDHTDIKNKEWPVMRSP